MSVARTKGTKADFFKLLMVNNCAYAFGQVTVKISLCLLYRQLFTSPKLHKIIDITIVYSILWGVAFIGVAIFSCRPIHAFWDFTLQALPTTYCINNRAWYLGQAIPNILTDIVVLCMPIKQIWGLKLGQKSKLVLVFVFALGILSVITTKPVHLHFAHCYQCLRHQRCSRVLPLLHRQCESDMDSGRDRQLELRGVRYRSDVRQSTHPTTTAEQNSPKILQFAANTAACR
jgi:hypothetical protein